ncbi:hypothetical protein [Salinicola socius]|uniref:hypothetical protein n=1 Tax=Salinicola socius TaxID=404433 RepID=UPI001B882BF2|nr:hypothetical protein [Salinicola socius]
MIVIPFVAARGRYSLSYVAPPILAITIAARVASEPTLCLKNACARPYGVKN